MHAQVHIGKPNDMAGFGLAVEIQVEGVDDQALIDGAHAVRDCSSSVIPASALRHFVKACPYSRAFKHGAVVNVTKK